MATLIIKVAAIFYPKPSFWLSFKPSQIHHNQMDFPVFICQDYVQFTPKDVDNLICTVYPFKKPHIRF